jgi:TolB-like protein/Flp pilus assembly protein TadD
MRDHEFAKSVEELGRKTVTMPMMKQGKRAFLYSALGFLLLGALATSYLMFFKQGETLSSLAVMPFTNATGDQSLEYLTDGITESIINNLSKLSNLRVMSRASAFRYKGKEIDPQEIGKTLGVQAVLTGRMTQRPDGFSLRLELVDSRDNRQIWGDHYTRSLSDISSLETEIPKEISNRLRVSLGGEEQQRLTKASTGNTEAYQLYLKGRYNWNLRSPEALRRAIDFYSQAVEQDPMYVQAYSGLAETYVVMPVYVFPPPKDAYEKTKFYALKALEINPKHAEALSALAYANWCLMEFDEAEKNYKRAIELKPNYATAHHWYAIFLSASGRQREALAEIKKAQELDPLSLIIQTNVGIVLESEGRYSEAVAQYQNVVDVEPNFLLARRGLGSTYLKMGKTAEALPEFEKASAISGGRISPYLASTYALMGKREQAQKILAELELLSRSGERVEDAIALVYLALGEKKKAIESLNKLYENRFMNIAYLWDLKDFRKLSGLDSDPEIQEALKKIGVR